jgi:hypothetical protein
MAPCNVVVGRDGFSRLLPVVPSHGEEGAPPTADATGYVAPERLRGDPFDHRADVFSAGVMLWEMITGRSFRGLPPDIIAAWVVDGKVPSAVHPDDAPWVVGLAHVATRALSVNPNDRWPHVGVLGDEIETIAAGHIASRQEIMALLSGAPAAKAPQPAEDRKGASLRSPASSSSPASPAKASGDTADDTWSPSLSPTSVSIAPIPIIPIAPLPSSLEAPPQSAPPSSLRQVSAPPSSRLSTPPPSSRMGPASFRGAPVSVRRPKQVSQRQAAIAWSALGFALVLVSVTIYEVVDGSNAHPTAAARPAETWVVRPPEPAPAAAPSPIAPVTANPDIPPPPSADTRATRETAPESSATPRRPVIRRAPARRVAPATNAKPVKAKDDAFGI